MDSAPTCHACGQPGGPFAHAAYLMGETSGERRYLGWLCTDCARQHGSHDTFTAAMRTRGDFVWLVSWPGHPNEHSYLLRRRR